MLKKLPLNLMLAAALGLFGCSQADQQVTQDTERNQHTRGASTASPLADAQVEPMSQESKVLGKMVQRSRQTLSVMQQGEQKAQDPRVAQLAAKMANDAERESSALNTWQQNWYPNQPRMTPAEADQTVDANPLHGSGSFDLRWLAAMIELQKESKQLVQESQPDIQHAELKELASNMVTRQNQEIAQLQQLLQEVQ